MPKKKDETKHIHPTTMMNSLSAYLADVRHMQSVMDNAHRFLTDESLDKAKVSEVVAEQIKEAIDRMQQWRDAE